MRTALSLLLLSIALLVGPAPGPAAGGDSPAVAPGVVFYELTEDMYLVDANGQPVTDQAQAVSRVAVAQLAGWAALGTPLCPDTALVAPKTTRCFVNATGTDTLSLTDGKGPLSGTFTVVVQGDNEVDPPEFVVMRGTFEGDADLGPAFSGEAPLGFISNGTVTIDGGGTFSFSGTFRLPYSIGLGGKHRKPGPHQAAFYLGDDGTPIPVKQEERSLGFPTLRIEISFDK